MSAPIVFCFPKFFRANVEKAAQEVKVRPQDPEAPTPLLFRQMLAVPRASVVPHITIDEWVHLLALASMLEDNSYTVITDEAAVCRRSNLLVLGARLGAGLEIPQSLVDRVEGRDPTN